MQGHPVLLMIKSIPVDLLVYVGYVAKPKLISQRGTRANKLKHLCREINHCLINLVNLV